MGVDANGNDNVGGGFGGRQAISSRMDLRMGGWYMKMNFLRNFLFLSVCLPDPSILMRYWWNCCTSITVPVRSHLFGLGPVWFGSALDLLHEVGVRS